MIIFGIVSLKCVIYPKKKIIAFFVVVVACLMALPSLIYLRAFVSIWVSFWSEVESDTQTKFLNMQTMLILTIFMINRCLIDCLPIEYSNEITDASEIDDLTATKVTSTRQYASVHVDHVQGNASRINLPDDVEWIRATAVSQQQSAFPVVGSIFELIFAVSYLEYEVNQFCYRIQNLILRWKKFCFLFIKIPIGVLQTVSNLVRSVTTRRFY